MAFAVAGTPEVPAFTTVASYRLERLGLSPQLSVRFTETVEEGVNAFGIAAQRPAASGRSWELTLSSGNAAQLAYMANLMGAVSFTIIKNALTALGLTEVTDEAIATVVGQIDNVDSVIASKLEVVEQDRLAGMDPGVIVMGTAPPVTPP